MKRTEPLTSLALRGMSWTVAGTVATLAMQLVYTATMARLLDPEAFGVVAGAMVGLRFITYFARFGIGNAVVQRDVLEDADVRVAMTLSVLIGTGAGVLALAMSPVIAGAIGQTEVAAVMRWLALGLVVAGVAAVPEALLRRSMRFRALAIIGTVSFGIGYLGVGIATAARDWGVWSLVAATLTQGLILAIGVLIAARPSLRPSLERRRGRRILTFGGAVSLTGFLEFLGSNLDTLAVGRWAGTAALGQYSRATYLVSLPVEQLTAAASKVLLPSLSKVQHEPERFGRALLTGISVLSTVVMVPVALAAAAAPALVEVVLGPGWDQAASVLPVVGAAYGLALLTHLPALATEAKGAVGLKLGIQLVTLVVLVAGLSVVVLTGPTLHRLALAWLVAEAVRHGCYWLTMPGTLGIAPAAVARRFGFAAVLAVAVALPAVAALRLAALSGPFSLAFSSAAGLLLGTAVLFAGRGSVVNRDLMAVWAVRASAESDAEGDEVRSDAAASQRHGS